MALATALLAGGALLVGAIYMLRALRNVLHGPLAEKWSALTDAPHIWRMLPYSVLILALLTFGFFPRLLTDKIQASVNNSVIQSASQPPQQPLNLVQQ